MPDKQPWPIEIRVRKDRRALSIRFDDEVEHELPAEMLRVMSPSAEVQGHSREQRVTVGGKRDVAIAAVDSVGNYALKITFSDGHNTGLFSWAYLRKLGDQRPALWNEYLAELKAKGLSRDPPPR
ncbi:MAG TPA: DUF971 domain-containing protein [Bauldia sp.]|nr:DUF971 domain-containing protein [Bauldia sp.]